jgi:hypothetical protein
MSDDPEFGTQAYDAIARAVHDLSSDYVTWGLSKKHADMLWEVLPILHRIHCEKNKKQRRVV